MKTKSIMIIAAIMIFSTGLFAQGNPYMGKKCGEGHLMNIPDLTDEQEDQISDLRTAWSSRASVSHVNRFT